MKQSQTHNSSKQEKIKSCPWEVCLFHPVEILSFHKRDHSLRGTQFLSLWIFFFFFLMDIGMLSMEVFTLVEQELDHDRLLLPVMLKGTIVI